MASSRAAVPSRRNCSRAPAAAQVEVFCRFRSVARREPGSPTLRRAAARRWMPFVSGSSQVPPRAAQQKVIGGNKKWVVKWPKNKIGPRGQGLESRTVRCSGPRRGLSVLGARCWVNE